MLFYCLKYRKIQRIKFQKLQVRETRIMLSSKCSVPNSKKSKFFKEQGARGLLSNLRIRIPLSQIPLSGKFMPEMHLRQSNFWL